MDRTCKSRPPILPERVRRIDGQSFAFLPHRFLREGFLCSLSPDEQRLYLFASSGESMGVLGLGELAKRMI